MISIKPRNKKKKWNDLSLAQKRTYVSMGGSAASMLSLPLAIIALMNTKPTDMKKSQYGPNVTRKSNIPNLIAKHPHMMTIEWCPNCDQEVEIPAYGISKCPECGNSILPCSMCEPNHMDCTNCPYKKYICGSVKK